MCERAAIIVRIRGLLPEVRVAVGRHESSRRIEILTFFRRFQICPEIVENDSPSEKKHASVCRMLFSWCELVLSWPRSGRLKIHYESLRRNFCFCVGRYCAKFDTPRCPFLSQIVKGRASLCRLPPLSSGSVASCLSCGTICVITCRLGASQF